MDRDNDTRRLKMEIIGAGRNVEVVAKGKCRDYPCRADGWRCPVCTKALSEAYRGIIMQNYDSYQNDIEDLKTRRRQVAMNENYKHIQQLRPNMIVCVPLR